MKRFKWIWLAVFGIYATGMIIYMLQGNIFGIDPQLQGSAADPHTFMSDEQIQKAETLSRIHTLTFFLKAPLEVGIFLGIMGLSVRFRNAVKRLWERSIWQTMGYVFLLQLLVYVVFLPIDVFLLRVNWQFGTSNETAMMWLGDLGKNFTIEYIGAVVAAIVFLFLLRRSPRRWWLWMWLLSIPMILFIQFIQPVVLDPLYNDFQPLQDQSLKQEILVLASQAHIPAHDVFQVNMSARTNTINAYVNGIGSNARIVLWDTILQKLKKDEILTVMAHEMGHYVERHIYWGIAFGLLLSLAILWLSSYLYRYAVKRWGSIWGLRGEGDIAALPLLLLMITALNLASTPIQTAFSRVLEHRADMYAMTMTHDGDAAIRAFQKIAIENLSPISEPKLVTWFRGTHPTIEQRILYFQQFRK
jgi:STE24 endopeptidase